MTERIAVFAGTFDPVTRGHVDLIRRGARLFDRVFVAVAPDGPTTWIRRSERMALLEASLDRLPGVEVEAFDGLLVDHARARGARVLLRGVRTLRDFEYEREMAVANRDLAPDLDTVFLVPSPATALVSSSLVREVARLGGDVSGWVEAPVADALRHRLARDGV